LGKAYTYLSSKNMWRLFFVVAVAAANDVSAVAGGSQMTKIANVISCPMYKCITPDCPVANQETLKSATGCSFCPSCVCVCGQPCNIPVTGAVGVCHAGSVCQAVTSVAPDCRPTVAAVKANMGVVSAASSMSMTTVGHCLACVPPTCPKPLQYTPATGVNGCPPCAQCQKHCVKPRCAAPACPLAQQETLKGANNCPLCPHCMTCTVDTDCKTVNSYCSAQKCVSYLMPGAQCASMSAIATTQRCITGTSCTGGVCKCAPLRPCPKLSNCATQPTTLSNGCPGCPSCIILTR